MQRLQTPHGLLPSSDARPSEDRRGTYLIDKVLAMIVTEFLSPNYSMAARGVSGRRKAPGK
jgi:hypothetical protein